MIHDFALEYAYFDIDLHIDGIVGEALLNIWAYVINVMSISTLTWG